MGKRLFALILTIVTMLTLLCGCSSTPSEEQVASNVPEESGEVTAVVQGTVSADDNVPQEVQVLLGDYMKKWYETIGSLKNGVFTDFFIDDEQAYLHSAISATIVELRKAAIEDLSMNDCTYNLKCTNVTTNSESGDLEITALETSLMHFAATADVDSEMYDMMHQFVVRQMENGSWLLVSHTQEDSSFESFQYDEVTGRDANLNTYLSTIESRQSQIGDLTPTTKTADHSYARNSAYDYMETYADHRNDAYLAMDDSGGNCTNFVSQCLVASGIPMDYAGDNQWYLVSWSELTSSFISVTDFVDYAASNTGYGLVADTSASYYTGNVGDILMLGTTREQHATIISNMILDKNGNTVDYLICSNTANYRNYPAGAYFYTYHHLIKIVGWNNQ